MTLPTDPRFINMAGCSHGALEVISYAGNSRWNCVCSCGNTSVVSGSNLRNGHTKSCGCLSRKLAADRFRKHDMVNDSLYPKWSSMKARCSNPKHARYGGRGIKVCDRWLSFENFHRDMSPHPPGTQIDRINNDGDYEPSNCRWVTRVENLRNMSRNVFWEFDGRRLCVQEWSEIVGISSKTLRHRVNVYGWSIERALTSPINHETRFKKGERRK